MDEYACNYASTATTGGEGKENYHLDTVIDTFIHLKNAISERHCNILIDFLSNNSFDNVKSFQSVRKMEYMRNRKDTQLSEKMAWDVFKILLHVSNCV